MDPKIALIALILTACSWADPLVTLVGSGGLTPKGLGHSETRIQPDGKLEEYHQMTNTWSTAQITPQDLNELKETLKTTDYAAWDQQDKSKVGPSAVDGADWTLTAGPHTLHLWQLKDSHKIPLVKLVQTLQQRYQTK